ncbi:TonB-dependent receptor [Colwelliaceae bacterium MEBiC 14330]
MKQFSRKKLYLACLQGIVATALTSQVAFAAEPATESADKAADNEIEVIQVTGLRGSLYEAVNRKRFNDVVSDTIVAEDIGKMPDRNIAEALQRITGISIARDDGEGTSVTIRGIADNLNLTLINGQTVASAGDGRGIDFSSMPSSMISAVEVYKSPMAKHLEGSVGGTINILTARPLDVGEARGTAFVEGVYNDNNEEFSPALTFSYMTPITDTFGIAAAVSHEQIDTRTDAMSNWSWEGTEQGFYPTRWGVSAQDRERERSSVLVNLQWQPTDNVDSYLDVTYSKVSDAFLTHSFTSWVAYGAGALNSDSIITDPNTNTMTEFAVDNLYISTADENIEADIDTLTAQLGADITLDNWTLSFAAGYSKAETEQLTQQLYNFDHWYLNPDQHDALFRLGADRQYAYLPWGSEYYDPSRTDNHANETYEQEGLVDFNLNRLNQGPIMRLPVENYDEDVSFKVDAQYEVDDIDMLSSIEMGARWNKRSKETLSASQHLGPWEISFPEYNGGWSLWGAEPLFHDLNAERFDPINFMGGNANAGVPTGWNAIHDFDTAITSYTAHMNRLFGFTDDGTTPYFTDFDSVFDAMGMTPDRRGSADNEEETVALYLQANLDMMDGDLTGNVGVRYVQTTLSSNALTGGYYEATHGMELEQITLENDYDNVLPSLNLSYKLQEDMLVRFAAAKVMARPNFNQAKAGASTTTDGWYDVDGRDDPDWTVADEDSFVGGNVKLDPYQANQFDLSYEYYFSDTGMFSAGIFYKDIESYIFNFVELGKVTVEGYETEIGTRAPFYTEEDFLAGESPLPSPQEFPLYFESVSKPINGEGGKISGLELGLLTNFDFIQGLENFGMQANYTYADSEADYFRESFNESTIDLPYQYQSEHTYNVMGFYENDDLMIRVAYNWRSESLEDPINSLDGMAIWRDEYGQLDASFSYQITESIEVIGSVSNLLEESTQFFSAERTDGNLIKGDNVPTDRNYNQTYNGRTLRLGVRAVF